MERVIHQFEPIFDENSKILMLGTMPHLNLGRLVFTMVIHAIAFGKL